MASERELLDLLAEAVANAEIIKIERDALVVVLQKSQAQVAAMKAKAEEVRGTIDTYYYYEDEGVPFGIAVDWLDAIASAGEEHK